MLGKFKIFAILAVFCVQTTFAAPAAEQNTEQQQTSQKNTEIPEEEKTEIEEIYNRLSELNWDKSDDQERKENRTFVFI